MPLLRLCLLVLALAALTVGPATAELAESGEWPAGNPAGIAADVTSASPFTLAEVGTALDPVAADVTFYAAEGASEANPAPAVILLHGAGGVSAVREGRYAAEFTRQGVSVAVIDVFGARGGGRFMERLVRITEAMALADAFATKAWLAARPDVDGDRIALVGFSYGGMSATYAAYAQVADLYAAAFGTTPFAVHVAFYGPCIARFEDPATTGAPVLMLWGERDEIMDGEACEATAADLRQGGSPVTVERYDTVHRWDGARRSWRAPVHIADCRFSVTPEGRVRDDNSFFVMDGPVARAAMLAMCASREGYLIGPDEAVRRKSNAAMARFLNPVLFAAGG